MRSRLITRQRQRGDYTLTDLGSSDDGGSRRADLKFAWTGGEGRYSVQVLLSLCYHAGEDRVTWLLAAACTRPWRSCHEAPAHRIGLEELGASGNDEIPIEAPVLAMRGWSREECDRVAELLGEALMASWRTSAVLLLTEPPTVPVEGWPGLVNVFDVDDRFRRTLNQHLPLGCVVPLGARLYAAPCDQLPDFVETGGPVSGEALEGAITRLIQTRGRTPLPEEWADVPSVRAFYDGDPFASPKREPDAELAAKLGRAQRELAEARGVLTILRKKVKIATAERDRQAGEVKVLRDRLAELTAVDVGCLRAQLARLQEEADDYARAFEETEAERDELRRVNGLLAGTLVRCHGADDEVAAAERPPAEFPSFAELIASATATLTRLAITAEPAPAAILDHHPKAAAWRRKAWDALRTLDAYACARTSLLDAGQDPGPELSDVLAFARTGQPGSLISANIIALAESDTVTTNERLRQARTFRVDPRTNPAGRDYFGAHIALERFKSPAPRLHFLDDTDGTGTVYIGYLGAHLPTSKTN
ncbi:GAS domain-containing protein [Amycolatopsis sp. OK19-0408]|uniref:GAS domain-containing protein n=1 Tax=Amycolatopsis iheyensis TaxID=2945988 RepID=A0A9X2SQW6_9PSEU|nr:GAS domain-containing protein [Amycolatopsis iheyensis]MCR6490328.1 GAS domain-containing protein [Amycolatopsis iheyensis]